MTPRSYGDAALPVRAPGAPRRPSWKDKPPRLYNQRITIRGQQGAAAIEVITPRLRKCPEATVRVVANWEGRMAPGELIAAPGQTLRVLKFLPPSKTRRRVHFLCVPVLGAA